MVREKKKDWLSNTHIRQNRLQNKGHKKRPRRTFHNTQGKNPPRRHKHYKHIGNQNRSIQIYKENLGGLQERHRQQQTYTGEFNTSLSKMDRSSKQNINKDTVALNNTLDQKDLTDMYRAIHPKEAG